MPLINVIRGERIPDAAFNLRTPIVRIPLWLAALWWAVKGLVLAVVWCIRHWYVTAPAALLAYLRIEYGWLGTVGFLCAVIAVSLVWRLLHKLSYQRFWWFPLLGRWRLARYRSRWYAAMATARLAVTFDGDTLVPQLLRVRVRGDADILTVRMVTGQIPDDFAAVALRLTHTFGARTCRVTYGRRADLVILTLRHGDRLARIVSPLPVPAVPDLDGLPVGRVEDGTVLRLRLAGTQILVAGATGGGKASVIWSIVAALAGGVRAGIVRLWVLDPKGGLEMASGMTLFDRFACEDFTAMAGLLEDAVAEMRRRTKRLRGHTRQHQPTVDEPLIVIVIDELAALTAYLTDRQLKDRVRAALGVLLTQGRACGVHVVAAVQDPRKEVLPFRDLFPTRIALRLTEPSQADLVLGDGMRDRGAACDRIPMSMPGVGYLVLDGDPTPVQVRFSFHDDTAIRDLATRYRPVLDGEAA